MLKCTFWKRHVALTSASPVNQGDMILWRSDLVHCGAPPRGATPNFRAVSYTCMLPAALTPPHVQQHKLEEYFVGLSGDHRPNVQMPHLSQPKRSASEGTGKHRTVKGRETQAPAIICGGGQYFPGGLPRLTWRQAELYGLVPYDGAASRHADGPRNPAEIGRDGKLYWVPPSRQGQELFPGTEAATEAHSESSLPSSASPRSRQRRGLSSCQNTILQLGIALLALCNVALTQAAPAFTLGIRDSFMIAHSFHGHPNFGPAGDLHGATYTCDVEFATDDLVREMNWVVDIGQASDILAKVLARYNYKNLDELFPYGEMTTTEFMCRQIFQDICELLQQDGKTIFSGEICVKLWESHRAWASYTGKVECDKPVEEFGDSE